MRGCQRLSHSSLRTDFDLRNSNINDQSQIVRIATLLFAAYPRITTRDTRYFLSINLSKMSFSHFSRVIFGI
jgi:hypothetical protein